MKDYRSLWKKPHLVAAVMAGTAGVLAAAALGYVRGYGVDLLLSLLASPLLRSAFRASPEALAMGAPALRIIALSFFFAGTSIIFCSAFQSLGRSRWSLLVALLRQILLLLPAAALLLALKPALVWAAFPLSELISCFAAALLYRRTIQKQLL